MIDHDQFAAYLTLQGHADSTVRVYRAMLRRWTDWATAHGHDPYEPDPLAARAFARQLAGSQSMLWHARATLGHLCTVLEVEDVSAAIPVPRKPAPSRPSLTTEQARRLADHAQDAGLKGLAVLVGLYTAARRSEIASLAWRRVDLDGRTVTLDRRKTRDLHTVPLHPALRAELEQRRVPGELWVFPGRHGGHVSAATIWSWVIEVADGAGVGRVTPHQLRRTALTEANDTTRDLRAVQSLAGHTDPAVTALYTRVSEERMRDAVGALRWLRSEDDDGDDGAAGVLVPA